MPDAVKAAWQDILGDATERIGIKAVSLTRRSACTNSASPRAWPTRKPARARDFDIVWTTTKSG